MRYGRTYYLWDGKGNNGIQGRREGMVDVGAGGQWISTSQAMHRGGTVSHIHGMMMQLQCMRIRSQSHPQHQDRGQKCNFSITKVFHGSTGKILLSCTMYFPQIQFCK